MIVYVYDCTIGFDPKVKYPLFFDSQKVDLIVGDDNKEHNLSIEYRDDAIEKIEIGNGFMNPFSHKFVAEMLHESEIEKLPNEDCSQVATYIFAHFLGYRELKYRSVMYELSMFLKPLGSAINELESARIFNIDPKSIRNGIERVVSPEISQNGSGLLSALLRIYENHSGSRQLTFENNSSGLDYGDIFETINYSIKKISPQIRNLSIELDQDNGEDSRKIVGKVVFENGAELSIDQLSDGSLKWLTLVTALLTNNGLIILEEPESYFHPTMQQLLIELMREALEDRENAILFATHSETILDKIDPEEVILTYFRDGYTVAKRIEEPDKLNQAIHDTGFGLGWYFVTGEFDYDNVF